MAANQTECSRIEQKFVIKVLVAEKCKLCEIYRMCNVYRKACFSQKNVKKWVKCGFVTMIMSRIGSP